MGGGEARGKENLVVDFLEMSVDIDRAGQEAENSPDGKAPVEGALLDNRSVLGARAWVG